MSVDTFEPSADAGPAAEALAAATSAQPSLQDVNGLIEATRSLMIAAKNRHRSMDQAGEHGRVSVLFILSKLGPARPSAIAKECMLDLSTVSRHLRALEDEGHVVKSADPDDKRAFQVGLTERGHDFVQEFWRTRVAAVHTALAKSAWNADEVRTLAALLDKFVRDTEGCI